MTPRPPASLEALVAYLQRLPAMRRPIGAGEFGDGRWWLKFGLDIDHPLAWRVVQELGHVLNYVSVEERLAAVFKPVSPPPYLNGGPDEFLSWVIENTQASFTPESCLAWLGDRLPEPVDDLGAWATDD